MLLTQDFVRRKHRSAVYIFKPKASAQGKGIFLATDIQEVLESRDPTDRHFVVSEYISQPYLINGYKFDMRIYVLVSSLHPLKIWICREGLARFCAEKYSLSHEGLHNKFAHLTNYSINKAAERFRGADPLASSEVLGQQSKSLISQLRVTDYSPRNIWEKDLLNLHGPKSRR